jgi:tetratricopeptide (TPR) repeat protein
MGPARRSNFAGAMFADRIHLRLYSTLSGEVTMVARAKMLWWAASLCVPLGTIQPSLAQTQQQQLKTCQSLTVDADVKIRACTVLLETGRQIGGGAMVKKARWGITVLRAVGYSMKKDYDRASADYREAIRLDPNNNAALMRKALSTLQSLEATKQLNSRWESYLLEIQNDQDFANWSGPPLEIYRNAK